MQPFKKGFNSNFVRRTRARVQWKPVLIGLAVIGIVYWMFFSGGSGKDHKKSDIPVTVASVVRKDIAVYLNGLGTVQANNTVTLHSQVDGRLDAVLFKEGQDVKVGDVLVKIDPRTYQAQYDQAVANKAKDAALLDNARRDLKRYQELGKSVSGQTRDTQASTVHQLEATVAGDQAAVDNAKTLLSYTTIVAPMDARTGIRQVDVGNIVHPGDVNGLVVLTQLQPVNIIFSLPQQNLAVINEQLNVGKTLTTFALDASGKTVDTGALQLVDNQIDQNTGTIKLKSSFPNASRALWPGGFTNVRLMVTTLSNALVIPLPAVQRGPKNSYVFIYKPDDSTVVMRPVTVSMTQDQDAVITDGVTDGEQVVTDGMAKLLDGSKVSLPDDKKDESADKKSGDADEEKKTDGEDKKKHHHKKEG